MGQPNDWKKCVPAFLSQMQAFISKETMCAMNANGFTETTLTEHAAIGVTVMTTFQTYFEMHCDTRCGLPSVILEGTIEDWTLLRQKAEEFLNMCLPELSTRWKSALLPVLDRIVATRTTGVADETFWKCLAKRGGEAGSGGYNWFNGWVNVFFPYITNQEKKTVIRTLPTRKKKDYTVNEWCLPYDESAGYVTEGYREEHYYNWRQVPKGADGPDSRDFPNGRCYAPVSWNYHSKTIPLRFCAAFIGAEQDPQTRVIRPYVGWFITRGQD